MPRTAKPFPNIDKKLNTLHHDRINEDYTIEVITPMFGGGVETGNNDSITLIRPSSIRGHLRFWWRAISGCQYHNAQALRQREGEIWGTSENASPVAIEVEQPIKAPEIRTPNDYGLDRYSSKLTYALFSAKQNQHEICKEGFSFTLKITWPNQVYLQDLRNKQNESLRKRDKELLPLEIKAIDLDVKAAIWGWINFGGIGSRTRRGCGALYCSQTPAGTSNFHPQSVDKFNDWLRRNAEYYGFSLDEDRNGCRPWPTFPTTICLKVAGNNSLNAWSEAIGLLKQFRQGPNCGRDPGRKRPGRSRWPEAESVRELVLQQQHQLRHRPNTWKSRDAQIPVHYFPRAEFGLPIIFEIRGESIPKRGESISNHSEHLKPTLQFSSATDRLASPVILRPIRFADGMLAAMIAVLNREPLSCAYLKPGKRDLASGISLEEQQIRSAQRFTYRHSPFIDRDDKMRSQSGSAVEAFIAFAKEKGFKEIKP